jgi:hypothetical protein
MLRKIISLIKKIKWWWNDRHYRGLLDDKLDDEQEDDEIMYCQDCGCIIEWDREGPGDDIVSPAYVTASGDLFCRRCGIAYDEEEERQADEEADYWPDPMDEKYQDYLDKLTLSEAAENDEEECVWEDEE